MNPTAFRPRDLALSRALVLAALALVSSPFARAEDEKTAPAATISDAEYATARQLLHEGKPAEVVAMLEAHPAVAAKVRRAELPYALALLRTGREREAQKIVWRYKRTTENDVEALKLVGYTLLAAKEYDQAKSYFKLAQLYAKDDAETGFNMARCDAFRRLDDESATALMAYEPKQDELPKSMFGEAVGSLAVHRAEANIAKGLYDDFTLGFLKRATTFLPDDPAVFNMLAGVLIQRDDFDAADEVLSTMERKFDDRLELVQCQRALIQEKKGNLESAMRLAGDAIKLSQRKLVPALLVFSRCALKLQKYDEARRPLDDAILNAPIDVEARLLMSDYLFVRIEQTTDPRIRDDFMKQIENHLRVATGVVPLGVPPYERIVKLYQVWGQPKAAELAAARKDLATRIRIEESQKKKSKSP